MKLKPHQYTIRKCEKVADEDAFTDIVIARARTHDDRVAESVAIKSGSWDEAAREALERLNDFLEENNYPCVHEEVSAFEGNVNGYF